MGMSVLLRALVVSLIVCEAIITVSVGVLFLLAGRTSLGPEGIRYLEFAFAIGIPVTLLSCWICSAVARNQGLATTTLVGGAVGLLTSVLAGRIWGLSVDQWMGHWGHYWTSVDAWVEGLQLAIPSGIAGVVIGFFQARFATRSTARTP
jgi:hypothetical protein